MSFQILMCIYLVISSAAFGKIQKIVGGRDANIVDFPYAAAIRFEKSGEHICGGVIISNWHILTAAHCFYKREIPYSDIIISVGIDSLSDDFGTWLEIESMFIHDAFTGGEDITNMYLNDIALIKVLEIIEFNEFQNKISLPSTNIISKEIAMVVGWGIRSFPSNVTSDKLQKSLFRMLSASDCYLYFPFKISSDQFCAFNNPGIGLCLGDSGGPLVHNGVLMGIASISIPCATGIPDVFTNVYMHMNFITQHLLLQ